MAEMARGCSQSGTSSSGGQAIWAGRGAWKAQVLPSRALRPTAKVSPHRTGPHQAGRSSLPACRAASLTAEPVTSNLLNMSPKAMPVPAPGRLNADATAFVEEHRIRAYEVGPDQRATIVTIANLLQEVAGNHGVVLWGRTEAGYATDPIMVELNLIFAATRIQTQMYRYPKWGDLVSVETWFQPEGRLCACRNWLVRDAATSEVIGRATSTWVMLNTLTRRLAKIPNDMRSKMDVLAPNPARHTFAANEARLKIPDLELPPEIVGPVQVARRSDMDMNGHINNVTYLAWAQETVPKEVFQNYVLDQAETEYKSECMAGDTIESLGGRILEDTNGTGIVRFVHLLQRCNDEGCVELVRARTTWRPRRL